MEVRTIDARTAAGPSAVVLVAPGLTRAANVVLLVSMVPFLTAIDRLTGTSHHRR